MEQEVILNLLHQLTFETDLEQDLDQAGPDQLIWRNLGATGISIERLIHHLPEVAQRMSDGNARLQDGKADSDPIASSVTHN